jgi:hypothetical protein
MNARLFRQGVGTVAALFVALAFYVYSAAPLCLLRRHFEDKVPNSVFDAYRPVKWACDRCYPLARFHCWNVAQWAPGAYPFPYQMIRRTSPVRPGRPSAKSVAPPGAQ